MKNFLIATCLAALAAPAAAQPDSWSDAPVPAPVTIGGGMVATAWDTLFVSTGRYANRLIRYNTTAGWTFGSPIPPQIGPDGVESSIIIGDASVMTFDPVSNRIYIACGTGKRHFCRYHPPTDQWEHLVNFPQEDRGAIALAAADGKIYALGGLRTDDPADPTDSPITRNFWEYTPGGGWAAKAETPTGYYPSTALAWPGSGDSVYAIVMNSADLWIYSISGDSWSTIPGSVPVGISNGSGGSLAPGSSAGVKSLYYFPGGGGVRELWRYEIAGEGPDGAWIRLAEPNQGLQGCAVAYPGSGDILYGISGNGSSDFWRYSIADDRYVTTLSQPPDPITAVGSGNLMTSLDNGEDLYALRGDGKPDFLHYAIALDRWERKADFPTNVYAGALAFAGGGFLYGIADDRKLRRYSFQADAWTDLNATVPVFGTGSGLVAGGDGFLYASSGDRNTKHLYRYSIADNTWTTSSQTPAHFWGYGSAIVNPGGGDSIYAFRGNGEPWSPFWRYSKSGNAWETEPPADLSEPTGDGCSLCSPDGETIFAFQGGSNRLFSYSIAGNDWTGRAFLPGIAGGGACITYPGRGPYLYALLGGGTTRFHRYWIPGFTAPDAPQMVAQYRGNGLDPLPPGAVTLETGFVAKARVHDAGATNVVGIEVEVAEFGQGFTGDPGFSSPLAANGGTASVAISGLLRGRGYHWQARAFNNRGLFSGWVSFGRNLDADFSVRANAVPAVQAGPGQFRASDGRSIGVGERLRDERSVELRVAASDDDGDALRLLVEVRPAGSSFSGQATTAGDWSADGRAVVIVELPDGAYSWSCLVQDAAMESNGWIDFGGNDAGAPDFELLTWGGSLNVGEGCLQSAGSAGSLLLPLLLLVAVGVRRNS